MNVILSEELYSKMYGTALYSEGLGRCVRVRVLVSVSVRACVRTLQIYLFIFLIKKSTGKGTIKNVKKKKILLVAT